MSKRVIITPSLAEKPTGAFLRSGRIYSFPEPKRLFSLFFLLTWEHGSAQLRPHPLPVGRQCCGGAVPFASLDNMRPGDPVHSRKEMDSDTFLPLCSCDFGVAVGVGAVTGRSDGDGDGALSVSRTFWPMSAVYRRIQSPNSLSHHSARARKLTSVYGKGVDAEYDTVVPSNCVMFMFWVSSVGKSNAAPLKRQE